MFYIILYVQGWRFKSLSFQKEVQQILGFLLNEERKTEPESLSQKSVKY